MERKTFTFKNKSTLFWQQQASWGMMDAGNPAVWSADRTKQLTASEGLWKDEGHSQLYTHCSATFIKTAAFQGAWAALFSYPVWIRHFRKLFVCFQMLKKMHKIIQMLLSPQMGLKTAIHYFRSPLSNRNSLISTLDNTGSAFVTFLSKLGPEQYKDTYIQFYFLLVQAFKANRGVHFSSLPLFKLLFQEYFLKAGDISLPTILSNLRPRKHWKRERGRCRTLHTGLNSSSF